MAHTYSTSVGECEYVRSARLLPCRHSRSRTESSVDEITENVVYTNYKTLPGETEAPDMECSTTHPTDNALSHQNKAGRGLEDSRTTCLLE